MTLTVQDLMSHSFVITVDSERLKAFMLRWESYGLPRPRPFHGFHMRIGPYNEFGVKIGSSLANVSFSHLAAIKAAKALNWPYVFILEDDAIPCNSILDRLPVVLSNIPDDLKLLKLGWIGTHQPKGKKPNDLIEMITEGAHAYVVFSSYYSEYEHIFNRVTAIADSILINHDPKKVAVYHSLFAQKNPHSGYIEVHSKGMQRSTNLIKAAAGGKDFDI